MATFEERLRQRYAQQAAPGAQWGYNYGDTWFIPEGQLSDYGFTADSMPQNSRVASAYNDPNAFDYNSYIGNMGWQDLLRQGFDKAPEENYGNVMYGQDGGYDLFGTLVNRINATGWDDAAKKSAVQRAIEGHYGQTGSGFTEWTGPEAIAAWLGLPDVNAQRQANEAQQFGQQHAAYSAQADADSLSNALVIGGGLAGAWLGPGGMLGDLLGGGAVPGAVEEIAALTGSGGAGGAGAVGGATGGLGSLPGIDPSWGVNTGPSTPNGLQTFIGDPALGGMGSVTPDLTALAPTQNLGAGSIFNGATGGAAAGLGTALGSLPSVPPVPPTGGGGSTPVDPGGGTFDQSGLPSYTSPPATTGQGTALSRVIDALTNGGTPAMADLLSIGGTLGSTLLGMYGSNQQGNALRDIANQSRADRQPFLNKSLEWLNDPAAYAAGPGKASLDATLRALSVQGNPFGSPTSLAIAGDIANRNWQNAWTGAANIGVGGQDSRNNLLAGAAQQDTGTLANLARGIGTLTAPENSLENLLRQFRGLGTGNFLT